MSSNQSKPPPPSFGPKEAADALNEHGFLFQQALKEDIEKWGNAQREKREGWDFHANEYPVTAIDGTQTRIDLVLQSQRNQGCFICLEGKRPNPKFKNWLFFDRSKAIPRVQACSVFVESITRSGQSGSEILQTMDEKYLQRECRIFNYYLEASVKRRQSEATSSTETIEKALRQIIAGSTGLLRKMLGFDQHQVNFFRSIPVVVTTASMFEAEFNVNDVSRSDGTVDAANLSLDQIEFCAVNYHADDSLSIPAELTRFRKGDIGIDLIRFQVRSVFVVHASFLGKFLNWCDSVLTR